MNEVEETMTNFLRKSKAKKTKYNIPNFVSFENYSIYSALHILLLNLQ